MKSLELTRLAVTHKERNSSGSRQAIYDYFKAAYSDRIKKLVDAEPENWNLTKIGMRIERKEPEVLFFDEEVMGIERKATLANVVSASDYSIVVTDSNSRYIFADFLHENELDLISEPAPFSTRDYYISIYHAEPILLYDKVNPMSFCGEGKILVVCDNHENCYCDTRSDAYNRITEYCENYEDWPVVLEVLDENGSVRRIDFDDIYDIVNKGRDQKLQNCLACSTSQPTSHISCEVCNAPLESTRGSLEFAKFWA